MSEFLNPNPSKLNTIQTSHNLNTVYRTDEPGPGGAHHAYLVVSNDNETPMQAIYFQCGPRNVPESSSGCLDTDLLEIVRDRLMAFQGGAFACEENAVALEHVTAALNAMNDRVMKRASRGVLGTNNV